MNYIQYFNELLKYKMYEDMAEIKELYTDSIESFKLHIDDSENHRTIFNGRFGAGKTMFLKYFFNNQIDTLGSKKYYHIHLFPVNYSISSNDDVIKFIKYDIITHLLMHQSVSIRESIDLKTVSGRFLLKNIDRFISTLFLFIPTWGGNAHKAFEIFKDLIVEFKDSAKTDADELSRFIDSIEMDLKSTFEEDFITKLIQNACKELKSNGEEVVLIIDDLDRIDPDHIFRILNVFASHFDYQGLTELPNKYGFDKIILVGDIQNIRNIFKSKFGGQADFNGYIDKYYSKQFFHFENKKSIQKQIGNIFNRIKIQTMVHSGESEYHKALISNSGVSVYQWFYSSNLINTRQLMKFYEKSFPLNENIRLEIAGLRPIKFFSHTAITLHFLNKLFSSVEELKVQIAQCKLKLTKGDGEIQSLIEELVIIYYLTKIHKNTNSTDHLQEFSDPQNIIKFTIGIISHSNYINSNNFSIAWVGDPIRKCEYTDININELLIEAIDGLNDLGFFA